MKQSKAAMGLAGFCAFTIMVVGIATLHVRKTEVTDSPKTSATDTHTLGDSTVNQGYTLKVPKHIRYPDDQMTQQYRYTTTLNITNTSADVLQISPGLHLSIIGSDQQIYTVTADYLANGAVIGGPIQPGANMTLDVDFKLPLNVKPKTLRFQPDTADFSEVAL